MELQQQQKTFSHKLDYCKFQEKISRINITTANYIAKSEKNIRTLVHKFSKQQGQF